MPCQGWLPIHSAKPGPIPGRTSANVGYLTLLSKPEIGEVTVSRSFSPFSIPTSTIPGTHSPFTRRN
jgi:hypothetical protein